jgi:hypothetical protein
MVWLGQPGYRQWKKLLKVHDETDRTLFLAQLILTLVMAKNTPFWEAKWLHDAASKDIAPSLFKSARCKRRMVHTEMQNFNCIRNLTTINPTTLFTTLSSVSLTEQPDEIVWRWMTNG